MKEYWFEIPPAQPDQPVEQIRVRAKDSTEMMNLLQKKCERWRDALFLGYLEAGSGNRSWKIRRKSSK